MKLARVLGANPGLDHGRVVSLLELIMVRGYSRGQDLLKKWAKLRADLER